MPYPDPRTTPPQRTPSVTPVTPVTPVTSVTPRSDDSSRALWQAFDSPIAHDLLAPKFEKIFENKKPIKDLPPPTLKRCSGTRGSIGDPTTENQLYFCGEGEHKVGDGGIQDERRTQILSYERAREFAKIIDGLYVGSKHADVKNSDLWRRMYLLERRPVKHCGSDGIVTDKNREETMPCHICGIVLPVSLVQVDHHMPQKGPADYYILKTLRALGMTERGASGKKSRLLDQGQRSAEVRVYPKDLRAGDVSRFEKSYTEEKWTTNDMGDAFLSLLNLAVTPSPLERVTKAVRSSSSSRSLSWFGGVSAKFQNNILNLEPMCGECNGAKTDKTKVWPSDVPAMKRRRSS